MDSWDDFVLVVTQVGAVDPMESNLLRHSLMTKFSRFPQLLSNWE
jgi:hypothetical protein